MKNTTYVYITIGMITDAKQKEKEETKSKNTPNETHKNGTDSSITKTVIATILTKRSSFGPVVLHFPAPTIMLIGRKK